MGVLKGWRVIEFAGVGPGPLCGMLMADLGAEVICIERPGGSDLGIPVQRHADVPMRGKRSVALDLKRPEGRSAALRLVAQADALIEGWRPGVAERLGLGPSECMASNPRLVYGRMTGYGQQGAWSQVAGHDLNYLSLTGALDAIGTADGGPVPPLNLVADYGGGTMFLVMGMLAALLERERSGRGQVVDAAMVDGASTLMSLFHGLAAAGSWQVGQRQANVLDGGAPFYATYRTGDGRWMAVAALEGRFFATFASLIGLEARYVSGQYDRDLWPGMRAALTRRFAERSRDEWCAVFDGTEACVTPVLTLQEAPHHLHARSRNAYLTTGGVTQAAPSPRFDRTPSGAPGTPAAPGADTRACLVQAGMAAADVQTLIDSGVAVQAGESAA